VIGLEASKLQSYLFQLASSRIFCMAWVEGTCAHGV